MNVNGRPSLQHKLHVLRRDFNVFNQQIIVLNIVLTKYSCISTYIKKKLTLTHFKDDRASVKILTGNQRDSCRWPNCRIAGLSNLLSNTFLHLLIMSVVQTTNKNYYVLVINFFSRTNMNFTFK